MQYKIVGGVLITPYRMLTGWEICIRGSSIVRVAPRHADDDAAWQVVDAQGAFVAPGFIDLHVHGGGGFDALDGTPEALLGMARLHAVHGTTALMPTAMATDPEELARLFSAWHRCIGKGRDGAQLLGIHLEGPYFAPGQCGAQDSSRLRTPDPTHYEALLAAADGAVARWSAAPELPGSDAFGRRMRDAEILASMGHSNAAEDEVRAAMENGFTHITHLYSTMSTITRRGGFRFPGLLECAYLIPDITAEIIADGCHVPPALLRFAYQQMGAARLCLVTDAMRGAGTDSGETILGSLEHGIRCIIEDGVAKLPDRSAFAGSIATADRLLRTAWHDAEIPLCDAVRMLTLTPARIAHLPKKGMLSVGYDADIVLFDRNAAVRRTFVNGVCVWCAPGGHDFRVPQNGAPA